MWLACSLSEKPLTMTLGLVSSAYTGFLGSSLFGCSPSWTWSEGGGTWTSHRAGDPDFPWGQRGRRRGRGEWEGVGKRGVNGNFYNLIKLLSKKKKTKKAWEGILNTKEQS